MQIFREESKRRLDERKLSHGIQPELTNNATNYREFIQKRIALVQNEDRINKLCPRIKTLKEFDREAEALM